MGELRRYLEVFESVVDQWCDSQSIPFFSATAALRAAAGGGRQVYFTYDNHWTPLGHEVVAQALHQFWSQRVFTLARPD